MTTKGLVAWNKGKKCPHTPEWERNRLEAIRKAAKLRSYPKGYTRPKEHVEPMRKALAEAKAKNPEKFRNASIANLPKNNGGEKNGNWKGGITAKTRGLRFSSEYKKWRLDVLKRDGNRCKLCHATKELQVHHIIPISQCGAIALLPMNGVTLCKSCHYENDEAWQGKRFPQVVSIGTTIATIHTIPHKFQVYETVGNWQNLGDLIVIFVSATGDWRYDMAVAVHELVEVMLCKDKGISQKTVDEFDIAFEKARPPGNTEEPGDQVNAPYRDQHCFATAVERMLIAAFGISWKEYEANLPEGD